jgi:two-component system, NtrC family, response regulator AtoC
MTSTEPVVELLGNSAPMVALREQVRRLLRRQRDAGRLPPILIQGETGTGKGLLARMIHRGSTRASAPFVDINCAAIPETLIEAELFGFERGAFTDARHAKPGLFQAAHRGTLFMDEVGLLPESVQGKLLKAIEERAVRRLRSVESEPTDIWIVAATSDDLTSAAGARRFRADLYHRLAALALMLPPLRTRGDDIVLLSEHFFRRACRDYRLPRKTLTADARQALLDYPWPGNVRELANVMERVALLSDDQRVDAALLRLPSGTPATSAGAPASLRDAVGDVERSRLVEALAEAGGNISQAAARLGIPRSSLRYRLEKHSLQPRVSVPGVAETRHGEDTDPTRVATGIGRRPIDWQSRHVAFLYVIAASEDDRESPSRAYPLGVESLDKVESFGGRIERRLLPGSGADRRAGPAESLTVRFSEP